MKRPSASVGPCGSGTAFWSPVPRPSGLTGSCDPDPGAQTNRCLEIILAALSEAGATVSDVVRTRIFITDPADQTVIGAAHGKVFGDVRPATAMVVVAGLLDRRWKVEIEAEAVVAG
jgi:enamine deaminase RidA (YjgF/YER057c/UK114 family)